MLKIFLTNVIVKVIMLPKFLNKKRIVLILLFFFLISALLSKPILAYSTPTIRGGSYQLNFESAVFKTEEMNLQSFVNETFKAVGSSIFASFVGCISCTKEEREKYPGFLLAINGLIAGIYASPPASGVQYLAYLGNKLGIVQPVYAQEGGIGFQALENVLPIWTAFRNISYVFFVFIFVFIGFAIMFRLKISPQAVVTIQLALPKIVLSLILVTFSYAIVGFMIDLMYVLNFLVTSVFKNIPLMGSWSIATFIDHPLFEAIRSAIAPGQLGLFIESLIVSVVFFLFIPAFALFFFAVIGPPGWVFLILLAIVTVIAMLRLGWTLLKAYAMIIVGLITAPFQILLGTIPGSNAIGNWFKNMLANIAVIPTALTMLFLSSYLILKGIFAFTGEIPEIILGLILGIIPGSQGEYDPGLIAKLSEIVGPVGFWNYLTILILPLTGLMILWMAPKVSDMIKSYLAGKPFEYGFGIGEAVGPFATRVGVPFIAQKYVYEGDWGRFDWARRGLLRTGEAARVLQKPMTTPE